MMKRRRSKYRIVVKTKAQVKREKLLKQRKQLRERQEEMAKGGIFSDGGVPVIPFIRDGFVMKEVVEKLGLNRGHDQELPPEQIETIKKNGGFIMGTRKKRPDLLDEVTERLKL